MSSTASSRNISISNLSLQKKIDGHTVQHLLKCSATTVAKKTKDSVILDKAAEERIPKFERAELNIGRVLGRGGFCVVNEITNIRLQETAKAADDPTSGDQQQPQRQEQDEHSIYNIIQDRPFMEAHCIRKGKDYRYAIKQLQASAAKKDASTFINGIVDLAIEARFLSVVRHPNIIKMRAMANTDPYSTQFFVVLDRLYDIMGTRLAKWKKNQITGVKKLLDRKGKREMAFWVERLTVAYDLACALKYLHDLNIVYRDIKPDNIGFDVRGDVKIFDFGLAKEIHPDQRDSNGLYRMTGDTGSPRYMAPEVAVGKPYNENVDVFSFSILLWQMLQLETPYEGYTLSMFRKKVVLGGARPVCNSKWPEEIQSILKRSWSSDHVNTRPTMEDVSNVLRDEINKNSDEEVHEIMDASRKSELSLRNGGQ